MYQCFTNDERPASIAPTTIRQLPANINAINFNHFIELNSFRLNSICAITGTIGAIIIRGSIETTISWKNYWMQNASSAIPFFALNSIDVLCVCWARSVNNLLSNFHGKIDSRIYFNHILSSTSTLSINIHVFTIFMSLKWEIDCMI